MYIQFVWLLFYICDISTVLIQSVIYCPLLVAYTCQNINVQIRCSFTWQFVQIYGKLNFYQELEKKINVFNTQQYEILYATLRVFGNPYTGYVLLCYSNHCYLEKHIVSIELVYFDISVGGKNVQHYWWNKIKTMLFKFKHSTDFIVKIELLWFENFKN